MERGEVRLTVEQWVAHGSGDANDAAGFVRTVRESSDIHMPTRYWLMKCEPAAYTIDDLARDTLTGWEGVRNYQARNFMRDDMQKGDPVLFYASNADPSGVTGVARIARAAYPDPFALKKGHKYYDAASAAAKPIWYTVDLEFVERFPSVVPLEVLKKTRGLEKMMVIRKGSRLSVQPVTRAEFAIVTRLGRRLVAAR